MSSFSHTSMLVKGKLTNDSRYGETGPLPSRSKRFTHNGAGWFCQTRRNEFLGPFNNFMEAEKALILYLRRCGIVNYKPDPNT